MATKKSKQERLDALRRRMEDVDTGGGMGNDFWKPPVGRSVIRLLPPVGDMEVFFQEVGKHYGVPGADSITCPAFTTSGAEECPICELVNELRGGSKQDKTLASKLRVRKQYWMNVIVRDVKDKDGNTGTGPFIFTPGITVFKAMQAMTLDPDYGDISDEEDGIDITIERSGEGMNTEYETNARRYDSPLSADPAQIDEWLEAAIDLSYVILDDPDDDDEAGEGKIVKVLTYDRLVDEYGLEPGVDVDDLLTDEDDEPEPVRASTKKRKGAATRDAKDDEVGAELRKRRRRR